MSDIDITDNTKQVMDAADGALQRALEIIGEKAESYAKALCPKDTGNLQNTITARVNGEVVEVGSPVVYAPYVELGTGKHYSPPPEWIEFTAKQGSGRDKWFYQDEKGDWHTGYPQVGRPFIRPAVSEHQDEYRHVIENEMQNAQ